MGGFSIFGGGGSDSTTKKNTTTTTVDQTVQDIDNRVVTGENVAFGSNVKVSLANSKIEGPVTIESTDQGAIQAGLQTSLAALDVNRAALDNMSGAVRDVSAFSSQAISTVSDAVQRQDTQALDNIVKYGALTILTALIVYGVVRYRSK